MMKEMGKLFLFVSMLFLFVSCKESDGLTTAIYEFESGYGEMGTGLKQKITVKYDNDGIVQKFQTQFKADYTEMGISREEYEKDEKSTEDYYNKIKGLTRTAKYGNKEAVSTIDVIVKDLPEEFFNVVFFFPADDSGNMTFKKLDDYYVESGYKKK